MENRYVVSLKFECSCVFCYLSLKLRKYAQDSKGTKSLWRSLLFVPYKNPEACRLNLPFIA